MNSTKKPQPVNQHIVPRFHLSHFTGPEPVGQVWTFSKNGAKPRSAVPKTTGTEGHFYSVENDDGTHDTSIEQLLSKIEGSAIEPYEKLINGEIPIGVQRDNFSIFIATMLMRTRSARRMYAELDSRIIQLLTHATAAHDGAFESLIRKVETREKRLVSQEERDRTRSVMLDPSSLELHIPKERTLLVLDTANEIAPIIRDMWWSVVEPNHGFIISSDNPVCKTVVGRRRSIFPAGFYDENVEVSFPLNPKRMLLMSWQKGLPQTFKVSREFIDERNATRVICAENEVYSHIRHVNTQRLVERYASHRMSIGGGIMPGQKLMETIVPRRWNR